MTTALFLLGGACALLLAVCVRLVVKLDGAYRSIKTMEMRDLSTVIQATTLYKERTK